jgi:hypothetical protein
VGETCLEATRLLFVAYSALDIQVVPLHFERIPQLLRNGERIYFFMPPARRSSCRIRPIRFQTSPEKGGFGIEMRRFRGRLVSKRE